MVSDDVSGKTFRGEDDLRREAFHEGEVGFQTNLGLEDQLAERGRKLIRPFMPDQHREFFEKLRLIFLSAVDETGHPHAMIRVGAPGFVHSPDNVTLQIVSAPLPGEPSNLVLGPEGKIGVVGVEPETRRRNRMNGTVIESNAGCLTIKVDQSFGNCAQYIQTREAAPADGETGDAHAKIHIGSRLSEQDIAQIRNADTLFIASRSPTLGEDPRAGLDINHRGGLPGFVKVAGDATLLIPDYKGNNFYNTLGNLKLDPRAGLLFIDFETGDILRLSVLAEVFTGRKAELHYPGFERITKASVVAAVRAPGALPIRFVFQENWPYLPPLALG